jgi:hypothetical protein
VIAKLWHCAGKDCLSYYCVLDALCPPAPQRIHHWEKIRFGHSEVNAACRKLAAPKLRRSEFSLELSLVVPLMPCFAWTLEVTARLSFVAEAGANPMSPCARLGEHVKRSLLKIIMLEARSFRFRLLRITRSKPQHVCHKKTLTPPSH